MNNGDIPPDMSLGINKTHDSDSFVYSSIGHGQCSPSLQPLSKLTAEYIVSALPEACIMDLFNGVIQTQYNRKVYHVQISIPSHSTHLIIKQHKKSSPEFLTHSSVAVWTLQGALEYIAQHIAWCVSLHKIVYMRIECVCRSRDGQRTYGQVHSEVPLLKTKDANIIYHIIEDLHTETTTRTPTNTIHTAENSDYSCCVHNFSINAILEIERGGDDPYDGLFHRRVFAYEVRQIPIYTK